MAIIPFDDRDGHIWYDGKLMPWRDAKTHVLTHGLHYGSSIFEGQRVYNRKVFKLEEAAQAHTLSETGHGRGRIVLHVAD